MGGLRYLQSKIGAARTKRLVLTGELISAQQAQEIGIISHAVDDPFASAFALQSEMQHLVAAVEMKKILALDNAALHSIDVDAWFSFLLQKTAQIDAQRIESAQALLQARQSVTQQREG
jgi:enoyl-CoA hydratase/carnithine racemase